MSQCSVEYITSNKFPWKLWRIIDNCKTGSICWSTTGKSIIIHQSRFQKEYLDPPSRVFKTKNMGSFVRQLNLYGFRKLNHLHCSQEIIDVREVHEFQHDWFLQGRPELLDRMRRNVGIRKSKEAAARRRMEEITNLQMSSALHKKPKQQESMSPITMEIEGQSYSLLPLTSQTYQSLQSLPKCQSPLPIEEDELPEEKENINPQYPLYLQWDGKQLTWMMSPNSTGELPNCDSLLLNSKNGSNETDICVPIYSNFSSPGASLEDNQSDSMSPYVDLTTELENATKSLSVYQDQIDGVTFDPPSDDENSPWCL